MQGVQTIWIEDTRCCSLVWGNLASHQKNIHIPAMHMRVLILTMGYELCMMVSFRGVADDTYACVSL